MKCAANLVYSIAPTRLLLRPACVGAENDNVLVTDNVVFVDIEQVCSQHPLQERPNGVMPSPQVPTLCSSRSSGIKRIALPFCQNSNILILSKLVHYSFIVKVIRGP